jgi:hypothetical protein
MRDTRTLTILALLAAAFPASASETVHLPGSGYTVRFPIAPECTSTTLEALGASIPKTTCGAFDEATGQGFSAEYMAMPEPSGKATPDELLMGAASGSADYSNSRFTSHQYLEVGLSGPRGYAGAEWRGICGIRSLRAGGQRANHGHC